MIESTDSEERGADAPENGATPGETPKPEAVANEVPSPVADQTGEPAETASRASEESLAVGRAESIASDLVSDPDEFRAEAGDLSGMENVIEALLLASETPLSLDSLQRLIGQDFGAGRAELRAALHRLDERYVATAMQLQEVAGGWRIQVRQDHAHWVARLYQEKPPKLSRATLETLALIVYRQPITRGEIESVRGVAVSSNILRTLLERGWIREVGHKEAPGRPALFGTTLQFLDDFNMKSLDQLPSLPEIKDADQLEAALARLAQQPGFAAGDEAAAAEDTEVSELAGDDAGVDNDSTAQDATVH